MNRTRIKLLTTLECTRRFSVSEIRSSNCRIISVENNSYMITTRNYVSVCVCVCAFGCVRVILFFYNRRITMACVYKHCVTKIAHQPHSLIYLQLEHINKFNSFSFSDIMSGNDDPANDSANEQPSSSRRTPLPMMDHERIIRGIIHSFSNSQPLLPNTTSSNDSFRRTPLPTMDAERIVRGIINSFATSAQSQGSESSSVDSLQLDMQHRSRYGSGVNERKLRMLAKFIKEFEEWFDRFGTLLINRLELQYRMEKIDKLWDIYVKLILENDDIVSWHETEEFRSKFFSVMTRAKAIFHPNPLMDLDNP